MKFSKYKYGFTIIELIVVITILSILGTIGFISYIGYISTTRDSTRLTQIQVINKAFEGYIKGQLPLPDNKVTIYANGIIIGYQGYAGLSVLSDIGVNEGGKDPLDDTYYSYFVDYKQKYPQLLTFLESERETQVSYKGLFTQANAADYTERYPRPFGIKLGILIQSGTNAPIQDDSNLVTNGLDVATTTSLYTAYFTQDNYITGTGKVLQKIQQSILHDGVGIGAPRTCPEGFIRVPGNIEFNQSGFCVAKYEMTYEDAVTPSQATWNVVSYQAGKKVVSKPGLYPITNLIQGDAITACKSMGEGFHLITNDEWMTLARDIESNGSNWSGNSVGSGAIFRGITGESTAYGCYTNLSTGMNPSTYASTSLNSDTTKWGSNKGADCDSKRQHMLSNGEIIWDLAGNITEHVNGANSLNGLNFATMQGNICGATNGTYSHYGTDSSPNGACNFTSPYSYSNIGPKTLNLNANNGVGMIYSFPTGGSARIFIRGGNAADTYLGSSGIYNISLSYDGSGLGATVGFRCAK